MDDCEPYVDAKEIARYLCVAMSTIYDWAGMVIFHTTGSGAGYSSNYQRSKNGSKGKSKEVGPNDGCGLPSANRKVKVSGSYREGKTLPPTKVVLSGRRGPNTKHNAGSSS